MNQVLGIIHVGVLIAGVVAWAALELEVASAQRELRRVGELLSRVTEPDACVTEESVLDT